MRLTWKKQYNVQTLAERAEQQRASASSFRIQHGDVPEVGFLPEVEFTLQVIASAINWPDDSQPEDQHGMLLKALALTARDGSISPEALLLSCNSELRLWRKRKWSKYTVATSLSFPSTTKLRTRSIEGAELVFRRSMPTEFDRTGLQASDVLCGGTNGDYLQLLVTLHAPDPPWALYRVRHLVDQRRALWNFFLSRSSWTKYIGRPKPLNPILWGPLTTVHRPTGKKLASLQPSYESEFHSRPQPMTDPELKKLLAFERTYSRRVEKSPIRRKLEGILLGYVQAFDHSDPTQAFQALWPVFEDITGGLDGRYDRNVRRMIAFFGDFPDSELRFFELELRHLKDSRNALVHEGRTKAEMAAALQQLRKYVHAGIQVFLGLFHTFPSVESVYEFLDLPADRSRLREKQRLIARALKLRAEQPGSGA